MALVAFDNTILSVLLFPDADLRQGTDAAPVDRARERVDGLVQELAAAGEQVLIPTPALAEVLATSDFPSGVVNVLSGQRGELVPRLASHMDVNAIDVSGCSPDEVASVEKAAADNVKRIVKLPGSERSPHLVTAFMEMKTIWHPIGV
jgi:hypothetical protein